MACNFHGHNLLYFFSFFSRGFNQSPLAIVFSLMNLLRLIKSEKLHHYAGHSFLHSPRPSRIRSIILLFIHILFMVVTHHSFQSSASLLLTRPFVISFTRSYTYSHRHDSLYTHSLFHSFRPFLSVIPLLLLLINHPLNDFFLLASSSIFCLLFLILHRRLLHALPSFHFLCLSYPLPFPSSQVFPPVLNIRFYPSS